MTKTSTLRQQTFKSPDFGLLGHADWDKIAYYRMPERRRAPNTEFDVRGLTELPRVDISMTYAGTHGTAIDAYVAAGAKGIVVGAMAPGYVAPIEFEKLAAAAEKGVTIVHSTRAAAAEWPTSHRAACPAPCSPTTYRLRKPGSYLPLH